MSGGESDLSYLMV